MIHHTEEANRPSASPQVNHNDLEHQYLLPGSPSWTGLKLAPVCLLVDLLTSDDTVAALLSTSYLDSHSEQQPVAIVLDEHLRNSANLVCLNDLVSGEVEDASATARYVFAMTALSMNHWTSTITSHTCRYQICS
jgi:hypothetical protein